MQRLETVTIAVLAGGMLLGPGLPAPPNDYAVLVEGLQALAPDPTHVAEVTDLVLRREAGTLSLHQGRLALLTPVAGRIVGAVFTGRGTFRLDPTTPLELAEIARLTDADSLVMPFSALVLLFTDGTLADLEGRLAFVPGAVPRGAANAIGEARKRILDEDTEEIDVHLAEALLDDVQGQFHAHLYERARDFLIFRVDPAEVEEVAVYRRGRGRARGDALDVVSSFPARGADAPGAIARAPSGRVVVEHYAIESTIAPNLDYSATTTLRLRARGPAVTWMPMTLYEELEVDSARWADGTPAAVVRGDEATSLWLRFESPLDSAATRDVTLFYHGTLLERTGEWVYLPAPSTWFPRPDGTLLADFDLTFHTPERYVLVAVGDLQSNELADAVRTQRWVTTAPTAHPGFAVGRYADYSMTFPRIPRFTVMMLPDAHADLNTEFLTGAGMLEDVAQDVGSSLAFFTEQFGGLPFSQLHVAEIPYLHGQAFPGLIHLSYATFLEASDEAGEDEWFRAHEVAHQWWGIGVDPHTYRDAWLSEGFASFAALWYLDFGLGDAEAARDLLQEWRAALFEREERVGPIAVGHRSWWEGEYDDYDLVVYRKGAWVLHMLRWLLSDEGVEDDDRFRALLQDFYATYQGRQARTADFRAVAERHAGQDLEWFFRQWVEGTALPRYRVAHRTERNDAGQYVVRLRIQQTGVPSDFRMQVPVRLEFAGGQTALERVVVAGPFTEIALAPVPTEPRGVVFNPDEAVLAEVNNVAW